MDLTQLPFYNDRVFTRIAAVIAVCCTALAFPLAATAGPTTVLVFPLENQTDDRNIDWIGTGLAELVTERLSAEHDLYVFNREERSAAYDRMGIPETVSVSRATAISLAWDSGADAIVIGKIFGTHQDFHIEARILHLKDASSGENVVVGGDLQNVIPLAASLSFKLSRQLVPWSSVPESDYIAHPPVPSSAFEAYTRGLIAADSSRRISLFQDAIRLHPKYDAANYQLGRQYFLDMDFKNSSPLLEKIPAESPDFNQAQFMLALNYYNTGDFNKSVSIFSAMPPVYDVLINLGMSLAGSGDFAGAMSAWKRALAADPYGSEALFDMAHLGLTKGERTDAEAAAISIEQFFKLQGRDAEALFLRGRIAERLGHPDDAQRLIAVAVNQSPRLSRWTSQALPNFRRLRAKPDVTAIRIAPQSSIWNEERLARRAIGRDFAAWLDGVQDSIDSERYGDALRQLQDIAQTFPRSAETRLMFAEVYEQQKQTDLAVTEYRKALAIKPSADTWVLLARLFRSVSQTASERQAIEEALKLEPANVAAANRKAELDGLRIPGRRRNQ